MSLKGANYPTIRPSLDLRFAQNKTLDPRITFSRASVGTYYDVNGVLRTAPAGVARFDHNPTTGESLGLLVEEARTNLMKYSQDISTLNYANTQGLSSIIPSSIIAPNGSITASKLVVDSQNNLHCVIPDVGTISGGHTLSVFAKAAEYTHAWLYIFGDGLYRGVTFDLSNGTVSGNYYNLATNIIPLNNGWYRLSIYYPNASNAGFGPADQGYSVQNSLVFQGDGTSGVYFWGAQLEAGSYPTSYIPTPVTFTSRSTTATYYDANGVIQTAGVDVARSNAYLPDANGTMQPAGLLLEGAGTNLVRYSEQFDNAAWEKQALTISSNNTTAPDGTNTADTLTVTVDNVWHGVSATTTQDTTTVTFSVFAKMGTGRYIQLIGNNDFGAGYANYDLQTGVVTAQSGNFTRAQIVHISNDWYRCSVVIEPSTVDSTPSSTVYVIIQDSGTKARATSFVGNGESVHIWGAQLETGSYPTSYIPTTDATATRAADVSSSATVTRSADVVQITGSNFSSWYNDSAGSFAIRGRYIGPSSVGGWGVLSVGQNQADHLFRMRVSATTSTAQTEFSAKGTTSDIAYYSTINAGRGANGAYNYSVGYDDLGHTASTPVALSSIVYGGLPYKGSAILNFVPPVYGCSHYVSRLTYYPVRFPDATLQRLTT